MALLRRRYQLALRSTMFRDGHYLVFLEAHYGDKVWTKYEKDIMTTSGRKEHIIPVLLDDVGASGAVGVSATVGRIDLRAQWSQIRSGGVVDPDVLNAIRNRCVIPLLDKLDSVNESV